MPKQLCWQTLLPFNFQDPPGRSEKSRTNSITPMTFLFIESRVSGITSSGQDTITHVKRTGQGVTLLYLSFFEPDTTFKCMNEIFLLLANPCLDHYFRDRETGQLKKEFIFLVDNGPQEKPSSPLVQMCMARLMGLLKLHKISQLSFAEYNSKRNFVERVHSEENRVLLRSVKAWVHENFSFGYLGRANCGARVRLINVDTFPCVYIRTYVLLCASSSCIVCAVCATFEVRS